MENKTQETEKDTARDQARAQTEGITEMVKRLEHAQNCTGGEDCEVTDKDVITGTGYSYTEGQEVTDEDREKYHDEEDAAQLIQEDPLSVEVRTDWHVPGAEDSKPTEFNILLCTGGPAVRIMGDLDEYGQPSRAYIQYQDWGTPWTDYLGDGVDAETLLTYAQQFYFGE